MEVLEPLDFRRALQYLARFAEGERPSGYGFEHVRLDDTTFGLRRGSTLLVRIRNLELERGRE